MERIIWLTIMVPLSAFFTGLGIYAWRRKKPTWFWSGSTVSEEEISDIPAYNRANGKMWIAYSCVFWLGAILGVMQIDIAGLVVAIGCMAGIPVLIVVYNRIFFRYRVKR